MNSANLFFEIIDFFALFTKRAKLLNRINLTDSANFAEDLFGNILNVIFDWELKNNNDIISNAKTVDLVDKSKKVCFQVTTQNTNLKKKKNDTIKSYAINPALSGYKELYLLYLTEEPVDVVCLNSTPLAPGRTYTGLDTALLLKKIKPLRVPKKQRILEILKEELAPIKDLPPVWNKKQLTKLQALQPVNNRGRLHVDRSTTVAELSNAVALENRLVIGKPGIGKSYVLNDFNSFCWQNDQVAVTIAINDLLTGSADEINGLVGSEKHEWLYYLSSIKTKKAFLIFDAFDTAKEEGLKHQMLVWIKKAIDKLPPNWKILISVRTYDALHSQKLLKIFTKGKSDQLVQVPKFTIEELTKTQLLKSLAGIHGALNVYENGEGELKELIRIPYFLGIFEEVISGNHPDELSRLKAVKTQEQLLALFWQRKVLTANGDLDREITLRSITRSLFERESLTLRRDQVNGVMHGNSLDSLLADGILIASGIMGRQLSFVHNILYDFAIAVLLLNEDKQEFVALIRSNPKAPFIFRPSYWYLLSQLWDNDIESFWDLFSYVDKQPESHFKIIHQVLFNAIVAFRFKTQNELNPLLTLRNMPTYGAGVNKFLQALKITTGFKLYRGDEHIALELSTGLAPEFLSLMGAYIESLFSLAETDKTILVNAQINYNDYIFKARQLYPAIKHQIDWNGQRYGIPGILNVLKISTLTGDALLDPVLALLEEDNFPMDYFLQLSSSIEELLRIKPELADKAFRAIYLRTENSEDRVFKGGVVLVLNMSRAQEWESIHHQLERFYPDFLGHSPALALKTGLILINQINNYNFQSESFTIEFEICGQQAVFRPDNSGYFEHHEHPENTENILKTIFNFFDEELVKEGNIDQWSTIFFQNAEKGILWRMYIRLCRDNPELLKAQALGLLQNEVILISDETANDALGLISILLKRLPAGELSIIKSVIYGIKSTRLDINDEYLNYKLEKLKAAFEPAAPKAPIEKIGVSFSFPIDEQVILPEKLLAEQQNPVLALSVISQKDSGKAYEGLAGAKLIFKKLQDVDSWLLGDQPENMEPANMTRMQAVQKIALLKELLPVVMHLHCVQLCAEVLHSGKKKPIFQADETGTKIRSGYNNPRVHAAAALNHLSYIENSVLSDLIREAIFDNDREVRLESINALGYFYRFQPKTFWLLLLALCKSEVDVHCLRNILRITYTTQIIELFPEKVLELLAALEPKVRMANQRAPYLELYVDFVMHLLFQTQLPGIEKIVEAMGTSENFATTIIRKIFSVLDQQYQLGDTLTEGLPQTLQKILLALSASNLRMITGPDEQGVQWRIIHEIALRMHFFVMRKNHDHVDRSAITKYRFLKPLIAGLLDESYRNNVAMMIGQTAYYVAQTFEKFIDQDAADILFYIKQLVKLSEKTGFTYDSVTMKLIMSMFEIYLADHKELIMVNPHFQYTLDTLQIFANAGWDEPLDLIWRLGDIL